jgi:hypothetical protein
MATIYCSFDLPQPSTSSSGTELFHSAQCSISFKRHDESDEISHTMPGKKDFKSMKRDDTQTHVQKRLILGNLKEMFNKFKNDFPDVKIGFSQFCQLRPRHVILAGAAGTHSVCVRVQHQNIKLMANANKLNELTKEINLEKNVSTLKPLLALMSCNPPPEDCLMNKCTQCPDEPVLQENLQDILECNMTDAITYNQYLTTNRYNLYTVTST